TQGPHEAIVCARPALTINKVSTWGSADIFYDRMKPVKAAYKLLDANLSGENYSYDLADISRQALTDYSKSLLDGIRQAHAAGNTELFNRRRDAFLDLILDLDRLLSTNSLLTLGHWTERARAMADEAPGTTSADGDWLELNNARTLITTWGPQGAAEGGGLRDYSYREWGGMLRDFYYPRWKTWFDNDMKVPAGGWFQWEWNWAHSNPGAYSSKAEGDTREVASELLPKYLSRITPSRAEAGEPYFIDRLLETDAVGKYFDVASPGADYCPAIEGAEVAEIAIDFSKNGRYEATEIQSGGSFSMPENSPVGERICRLTLTDGTVFTFTLRTIVEITEPRTVSVASANAEQGSVSIDGTDALSLTGTDPVICRASALAEYDFDHWTDAIGNNVGNDNPLTYYGRGDASFTAHFVVNKWGVPADNGFADKSTIKANGEYIKTLTLTQNGETKEIYTSVDVPERQFVQIPTRIKAAPGGEFSLSWADAGGLGVLTCTAFLDSNGDGTFDVSSPCELLNTSEGGLNVLLPFATEKGTTHIRLRFDSPQSKELRPDSPIDRFVYEILLEVVDSPDYACKVTYAPNDDAYGSMRSENESMVYNPGEEVVITAFPAAGCIVRRWVDNHGRELPAEWIADNGLSVNFKAFDNAHITAEFEPLPLEVSGWKFGWEGMANGKARLTQIIEQGDSHLNLSAANPVVGAIAPGLFAGCDGLTEVTLPEGELTADGAQIFSAKITGDGTRNKITEVSPVISGTDSWVMTIEGTAKAGVAFDDYGSGLYGNGTDCLADNFTGGWSQFFLKKDGTLSVKWDSADAVDFTGVKISGQFFIRAAYDAAAKQLRMTVTSNGNTQTRTIPNSSAMKDISRFATALPSGIDFTLTFRKPDAVVVPGTLFGGATSIMSFHCVKGSSVYKEEDGIIYKPKSTRVWAYPEGRLCQPFTLKKSSSFVVADPAENMDLTVSSVSSAENPFAALWTLCGDRLVHANSGLHLNAAGTELAQSGAEFAHELVYGTGMPSLKLTSGKKTHTFKFEPLKEVSVKSFPAAMALPVNVEVPASVKVGYVLSVDAAKGVVYGELSVGDVIPASKPFVVIAAESAEAKLPVVSGEGHGVNFEGVATGILMRRVNQQPAFVSVGNRFVKSTEWAANSIVIPVSAVPVDLGDSFPFDLTADGLKDVTLDKETRVFDILGRPVRNPGTGLYITPAGKQVLQK
ncbi:MAG: alpha-N-acetylglucosaminidase C-terminal domain-containing protein, partial [Muribaculaceae bacterium]|nr:alpha-N-acetylglucosaminidase C-terminal domain-containing protein [Muribaculaceae bacterium]